MKNNDIKIIFTLGRSAQEIGKNLEGFGAPVVHLSKENIDKDYLQEKFYLAIDKYISANSLHRPMYKYRLSDEYIPRKDLPFMTRWWMGTSGDLVARAKNMENIIVQNGRVRQYDIGQANGDYYKLYSPSWATSWAIDKRPLTSDELQSIEKFKEAEIK